MAPLDSFDTPSASSADDLQQDPAVKSQIPSIVSQAANFLSRCNLGSLVAIAFGLLACLYLIFGRLALLLFGVVGGVLLHAWWDEIGSASGRCATDETKRRRRELGVEVAARLMRLEGASTQLMPANCQSKARTDEFDLSKLHPALAAALKALIDAVVEDYVRWWYEPILPAEQTFPYACRNYLVRFVCSVSAHLGHKRPAEIFLQFVMNSSSVMIVLLSELSLALGPTNTGKTSVDEAINAYLVESPESGLANILSVEQQQEKLSIMANELLKLFLDPSGYNCEPVRIFLREILTGVIFTSIIETCSAPEYINGWIIHLFETGEPEFINAIDAGLDALDQVSNSNLEPVPLDLPSTITNTRSTKGQEPPADQPRLNAIKTHLAESEPTLLLNANRDTRAGSPNRNLDGAANSDQGLSQPRRYHDDIDPFEFPVLPLTLKNGDSMDSNAPEIQDYAVAEDESAPPAFTDGSDLSKEPNVASARSHDDLPEAVTSVAMKFHNASVSILDDYSTNDGILRSKPTVEYLLQIELKRSHVTGWMIARKYTDFESLHETLRRISVVSGITEFSLQHSDLPSWKNRNGQDLRERLERYLQSALRHECLADCEGMKRFLEKDLGTWSQSMPGPIRMGFPFRNPTVLENMGKGMLGVISTAPKGVAEGGKAMFGGMSGLFNSATTGSKKASTENPVFRSHSGPRKATAEPPASAVTQTQQLPLERAQLYDHGYKPVPPSVESAQVPTTIPSASMIPIDPNTLQERGCESVLDHVQYPQDSSPQSTPQDIRDDKLSVSNSSEQYPQFNDGPQDPQFTNLASNSQTALSEDETIMVVELLFAVVNEIYGLSSAWKFRKRLLHAAKTFLLRPGNPNLDAIRLLIQDSVIQKHTTHKALADYINMLRESRTSAQNQDEPSALNDRKQLRDKARSLFIANGMPRALVSCMGTTATGEALGRIFDCLQVESVAKGFVCALLLQALKVIVQ
ncbi:predicted protein [Uncinocarpus reesii 1704]|uniref:PXA domain-containing protein n=1 Tax=Uncinocarpus reesii (strain UAMH 1704) TaxID=336963 RepID=C4JT74_UNCRE|nr:uncharacterized protein UREG_05663 [Uncinocarpus reesii 1704]EEP80821.1 predicted protein [Uncinocarpus reesii 1704]